MFVGGAWTGQLFTLCCCAVFVKADDALSRTVDYLRENRWMVVMG